MEYIAVVRTSLLSPQLFDVSIIAGNIFDIANKDGVVYMNYKRGHKEVKLNALIAYMIWKFPPFMDKSDGRRTNNVKLGQFNGINAELAWIIKMIDAEFNYHLGDRAIAKSPDMPEHPVRAIALTKLSRSASAHISNSVGVPKRVTDIINDTNLNSNTRYERGSTIITNKWRNHSM